MSFGVEDTSFQVWAGQELIRTTHLPIVFVKPSKRSGDFIGGSSKEFRFIPIAAKYHQKLIRHVSGLIPAFETQLFQFPSVDHDDMIDAEVIAISLLTKHSEGELSALTSLIEQEPIIKPNLGTNTCGNCRWFKNNFCELRRFKTSEHEPECSSWQTQ